MLESFQLPARQTLSGTNIQFKNMNMIEPIIYNQYIDRVGIEFEGLYTRDFKRICYEASTGEGDYKDLIYDLHSDCSVHGNTYLERQTYLTFETLSRPLKGDKLAEVLQLFSDKEEAKEYNLNSSCGLHFHVSLNKYYYAYIDNQEFYDEFVQMFKKKFPDVYAERKNEHYCKVAHEPNHFKLCSQDRYASINYCYTKHKTVEFRCYGGKKSTIKGLADMIQQTLNLIGDFIERREAKMLSLVNNIEVDIPDKKYAKVKRFLVGKNDPHQVDVDIPKRNKDNISNSAVFFTDTSRKIELNIDLTD